METTINIDQLSLEQVKELEAQVKAKMQAEADAKAKKNRITRIW